RRTIVALAFYSTLPPPPRSTLFPYTTLFRSNTSATESRCAGGRSATVTASCAAGRTGGAASRRGDTSCANPYTRGPRSGIHFARSEEHTSELQSRENLVCRLLLEKKKEVHLD